MTVEISFGINPVALHFIHHVPEPQAALECRTAGYHPEDDYPARFLQAEPPGKRVRHPCESYAALPDLPLGDDAVFLEFTEGYGDAYLPSLPEYEHYSLGV